MPAVDREIFGESIHGHAEIGCPPKQDYTIDRSDWRLSMGEVFR